MLGFTPLDLIVMASYLAVVVAIGIWSQLRVRNREDYFLGGRSFGKLVQIFASFGQATSADGPVGVATTTFRNGAAGIWSALMLVFSTPLFWITSPWLRRLRVLTMGDFYTERYGSRRMAATYALIATLGMMGLLSAGYTAVMKTAVAMTPKPEAALTSAEREELRTASELNALEARPPASLSRDEGARLRDLQLRAPRSVFSYWQPHAVVWAVCFVTLLNAVMGGLAAAFYTDLLQGFFILVLSIVLIPFSWARINAIYGGHGAAAALATLHAHLPESFFEVFGSPKLPDFTWYYVAAVSAVAGITVVTQPNQLVTNAAAKDEQTARIGMVTGSFMKRICTILWCLCGLSAVLLYTGTVRDSDLIWGCATRDLLGPVRLGLVGLMLVGLLSALMAASNSLMLTISGLVVNNLYRPLRPDRGERHDILVGRIAGALFLAGGALITTQFDNLLQVLKFVWEFFVIFSAAFWLGLKWRRANRAGAWASILLTFAAFYFIPAILPVIRPSLRASPTLLAETRPRPIVHAYRAKAMDVAQRQRDIAAWRISPAASGPEPAPLALGQSFTRAFNPPPQGIFWSQGVRRGGDGRAIGTGYIYLDLVALRALGLPLERYPFAAAETLRLVMRLLFPFAVLIAFSLATPPDDPRRLNRFYAKMRTKVSGRGAAADAEAVARALEDPDALEAVKVVPGSDWEIYRWNRGDLIGFLGAVAFVFVVLGLLAAATSAGS